MEILDSLSPKPEDGSKAKVLYGQAYFCGDALVQDLIYMWPGGQSTQATVELIKNIWDDLTSASSKIKTNEKKNYFYWPVTMSSMDDVTVQVNIEAPKPKPGLFSEPFDKIKENNDWVKFYKAKIITAKENYEEEYAIQKKNISMPGTQYISQTGETIKLNNLKVSNNALGDIENLLSLF